MSPFQQLLGDAFATLPPAHRRLYEVAGEHLFAGTAQVWRSGHPLAGPLCDLVGLPAAGRDVPVTLRVWRGAGRERWQRDFAARRYTTRFHADGGLLVERMGLVTNRFRIKVVDGRLRLDLVGFSVLGVPLPHWLRPRCRAVETGEDGAIQFDIPISMPGLGPIIHYNGRLVPVGEDA